MAITSTGFDNTVTDKRVGLKSSVYDKIILIGAEETPLMTMLQTSPVKAIEHSWIIDNLAEPKKNAQLEISDFTGLSKSTKQKRTNSVQIFTTNIMVSETMQNVATYGGKELEYEVTKKAKEHKKDIEYALFGLGRDNDAKKSVLKAPTSRDDATAGEMAGIFHYVAKGKNTFTAGKQGNILAFDESGDWSGTATQLTEAKLNQILQTIWDSGATPKDVFIGAKLKAAINAFASRQFGNEKMVNSSVVSLDTDFGKVNFRLHRYLSEQYELSDCLIAGDFNFAKLGMLVSTKLVDVPTSKTAKQKRYYTEATLEVRNADAFAIGVGLI
ncbi:hypothetical protein CFT13S00388_07990 [Campylobacter fetus subsp. testudinum]|uniref:SU10 major capsid protein n=1 Tax=Campylobacter fetus TaxID=196 RepID=UPI000818A3BC|nr:DUF5309 family protein [Campylobacter fetus]OCR86686.1 hypothetical protein CFT13S00388_07990 [Campylobacter fetus subsp. testudinum]